MWWGEGEGGGENIAKLNTTKTKEGGGGGGGEGGGRIIRSRQRLIIMDGNRKCSNRLSDFFFCLLELCCVPYKYERSEGKGRSCLFLTHCLLEGKKRKIKYIVRGKQRREHFQVITIIIIIIIIIIILNFVSFPDWVRENLTKTPADHSKGRIIGETSDKIIDVHN